MTEDEIKTFEDINISMPMIMPNGEMMTINVRGFEWMNLDNIGAKFADIAWVMKPR